MTGRRALMLGGLFSLALLSAPARAAEGDRSLGQATAAVTVVEYASVTCSHCAAWHTEVWPAFKARWVDTGKVRFVLRELPTPPAELATAGFLVARCAGAKYFDVVHALWEGQERLFENQDAKAWLVAGARAGGLSEAQVDACATDAKALDAFNKRLDANLAQYEVKGTPTFFVDGKPVGASLDELDRAIAARLTAKPAAKKPVKKG